MIVGLLYPTMTGPEDMAPRRARVLDELLDDAAELARGAKALALAHQDDLAAYDQATRVHERCVRSVRLTFALQERLARQARLDASDARDVARKQAAEAVETRRPVEI